MKPVTDEDIIERLAKGVLPWRRPWSVSTNVVVIGSMEYSATTWPSNLRAPKVPFGMFNGTMLLAQASKRDYRSNLWVTESVVDHLNADLAKGDDRPVAIQRYLTNTPFNYLAPAGCPPCLQRRRGQGLRKDAGPGRPRPGRTRMRQTQIRRVQCDPGRYPIPGENAPSGRGVPAGSDVIATQIGEIPQTGMVSRHGSHEIPA